MGKPHGKDILQEPQITGPQEIPRPFKIQKISDSTSNPSTPLKIYGDSTDIFLQNSLFVYDEEHVQDSVQERQLSLIGKLLAEKDIPDGILQKILNGIWCNPSGLKIQEIGEKLYLLNIEKEEDLKRILKGSPWNVRNCLFMVKQWNMNTSKEVPTSPIFFSSTAEMERLSKDFKGKAPMEEVPGRCLT